MNPPSPPSLPVVQVLVSVDAHKKWTTHSLELLGDARAVADRLHGTVGALFLTTPGDAGFDFHELAAHGCSHVQHLKHNRFEGWSSEVIADEIQKHRSASSRLILLPGTARGEEVAALLAGRLETTWIPDALTLAVTRTGALEITAVLPGGRLSRTFKAGNDRLAVVTIRPGVAEIRREKPGPIQVDEWKADLDHVPSLTSIGRFIPADPKTIDITFASRIVSAGRGTGGPEGVQLVAKFADTLRASLGASRMAVDLGWVPQPRQVGQTGRTVKPDLYVACGISGASHHLAGMRDSKHIVAINSDPKAPIHDVAHLSLKADLQKVIPCLIETLSRRRRETRS